MKLRFYLALFVSKAARTALRLLGRNATYMPGVIALKICPDFLGYLKKPETLICVTGTNGKTTVSNLLTSVLRENGYSVTNNSYGSNVQAGIAGALLAESTLSGKSRNSFAVIETDERSSLKFYPYMAPDYFICNNIMRDSQKRNAHTEFISYIINSALPASAKVVLNADDVICSGLVPQCRNRTYFGISCDRPEKSDSPFVRDIVYCPACGEPLEAEYLRYNHIGRMHCSKCSFASPAPDFEVTSVNREANTFTVKHDGKEETFRLVNDNIVNVYNCCGAIALLTRLGLTYEQISKAFESLKIVSTRYDTAEKNGTKITLILSKGQNPIACSRVYSYVSRCPGDKKAVLVMDDDKGDNTNDSESTCWLYDTDYSFLKDETVAEIVFSGPRCKDRLLRAALAGVDISKIKTSSTFLGGASMIDTNIYKDIYILYDPYLLTESRQARDIILKGAGD